ncbi:MAG: asparagine synthase (glutamine-hydrolyzing) [Planctomycetaceae bacterium]|nr:asparagine synthase (glutamine-hydrolyzing) [Planctomycetaceae bacterium]
MCGIAGIVKTANVPGRCLGAVAAMQLKLRHRGPDDEGLFEDPTRQCALAHTRLAIQDLSTAGQQPMESEDGRFVIVFNGEIYNFPVLRQELVRQGEVFRSQTDTEVLLKLYAREGQSFLPRLQGMFAFAVWDSFTKTLFLARDPLGIKPLYIWRLDQTVAFASEIRAVLQSDIGPRHLNTGALYHYLRMGSVQEPDTLIENISLLPPGHSLIWHNGQATLSRYWNLALTEDADPVEPINPAVAAELTRNALTQSVEKHFVSDVPVGVFLSGGLDSTALVGLASAAGHRNLQTFCISFDDDEFNEGGLAARTARHFQTDHTDVRFRPEEAAGLIEDYLSAIDQPCNDGFNTFCVSRAASQHGLKVVLSGLGGDELFGGYPSFRRIPQLTRLHRRAQQLPGRRLLGRLLERIGHGHRVRRLGEFLSSQGTVEDAWRTVRGFFTDLEARRILEWLLPGSQHDGGLPVQQTVTLMSTDEICQINELELTGYMRNQLLRESDVMSMASGLELRVPLVDQQLIDTVATIHSSVRLRPGKLLLAEAVPEIPEWIRNVDKRGFRFPFESWSRGPWKHLFRDIHSSCPVKCDTWYRLWLLFALQHFISTNRVEISLGKCAGLTYRTAA